MKVFCRRGALNLQSLLFNALHSIIDRSRVVSNHRDPASCIVWMFPPSSSKLSNSFRNRSIVRAFRTQVTPLPETNSDFSHKVVIVTGASSGVGKAAAQQFVRLRAAKVILACRSGEKGEAAKKDIEAAGVIAGVVEVWTLELGSYESIKSFCSRADKLDRLDVFVANAGLMSSNCEYYEGYERQTFVHVIAPILMVLLLLPVMRRTFEQTQNIPHHVIVSSNGHMYTKFLPGKEKSIFAAVQGDRDMRLRYYDTKLMEVLAVRELATRIKGSKKPLVIVNMVDPGYCQSDLLRENSWELPIRLMMGVADKILARTPDAGARTYTMAASAGEDSHGMYLEDCKLSTPSPMVETEKGKELQKRVWNELIEILNDVVPGAIDNV
jgi:retinol dehydrogenase 12